MAVAIDSHMSCLRNDQISLVDNLRVNAVMHMYFPSLDNLTILECLQRADDTGKNTSNAEDKTAHLPNPPFPYRKSSKIVIFLIGPSASS
ncbi:hypothetical protein AVEN_155825-1 [Araneus ventricosus]|uniref:Uncharacterized protein n=1 Tax=Araneus ventricosus TaxID=182803 RepID=A0A4Y2MYE9_ARAVE|nr:hypothetical protein AVEN_155825-1 [Araneus ventricosus]